MSKRKPKPQGPPTLMKLSFGSITGWWKCLRCGWELPGQLNPSDHKCSDVKKLQKVKR